MVGCRCCEAPDLQLHDGRCRRRRWPRTPVLFSSESVSLGSWEGRPVQAQNSSGGRNGRWRECPERVSPNAARQAARDRVAKLQQALVVLGETSGPEVDGLRSALAKAQKSASEPTLEVQVTECKSFIARAEKRVAALDAQRAHEVASLEEGRARLIRLESVALEAPQVARPPPEVSSEVLQLRELVSQLQAQIRGPDHQDAPCMPTVKRPYRSGQGSGPVPVMPRYIPAELSAWMGERQADLQDAFADGDNARILEIPSKLSEGAEHMVELTGGMMP